MPRPDDVWVDEHLPKILLDILGEIRSENKLMEPGTTAHEILVRKVLKAGYSIGYDDGYNDAEVTERVREWREVEEVGKPR